MDSVILMKTRMVATSNATISGPTRDETYVGLGLDSFDTTSVKKLHIRLIDFHLVRMCGCGRGRPNRWTIIGE